MSPSTALFIVLLFKEHEQDGNEYDHKYSNQLGNTEKFYGQIANKKSKHYLFFWLFPVFQLRIECRKNNSIFAD
jgi:hypothetical protein